MTVEWIILDAMGVIFEVGDDVNDLLIPFLKSKDKSIDPEIVKKHYLELSLGCFASFIFWENLGFGKEYPEIERTYLDQCITIDPDFKSIASRLRTNFKLALLSNDVAEWSLYLRTKHSLNQFFDVIVISGEVEARKPNLKIYELLLKKVGTSPKKCVFIDDKLENLQAASRLGIKGMRFVRNVPKIPFCSEFEVSSFKELYNVLTTFK